MSRGLTDAPLPPEPEDDNSELDGIINELIKGQNKLHDRLVDLERKLDHMQSQGEPKLKPKPWKRGL